MHRRDVSGTPAALFSAAFLFAWGLSGCAGPDAFGGSRRAVTEWASERSFAEVRLDTPPFTLLALLRNPGGTVLNVYIEGDGAAWPSPYHPPRDPTPDTPLALALAALDPEPAVAYLGRPCQYLSAAALRGCAADYWTGRRFAPEVVAAYEAALAALKLRSGARQLRLIGYSGGGVLATLLAGRRSDVVQLVTVAAPLAVAEWARGHAASPLTGSLDPFLIDAPLPPAVHFVGENDTIVPADIAASFVVRHGGRRQVVGKFDHGCCWSRDWRQLLKEIR